MTRIARPTIQSPARRDRITRRGRRWMLLLAFEVLVFGFAQASSHPVRRAGILIETTVTPNHVVT